MSKKNVLAVAEVADGRLRAVSREVASAARAVADGLGGATHVFAAGPPGTARAAAELAHWGADKLVAAESAPASAVEPDAASAVESDASAAVGAPGAQAAVLAEHVRSGAYGAVLFAASTWGKDVAPRVAARLSAPLLSDVTELAVDGGDLRVLRPVFAGKALARVRVPGATAVVTIRPNVFTATEYPGGATAEALLAGAVAEAPPSAATGSGGSAGGYRVIGFEPSGGATVDVGEAAVVVSGGRGMQGPEHWSLLEELRDALGETAALGASRAVVDAGWRPHAEQVGQTGKTVTPKLYFALGISGAIQHLAGMRTSGVIVAVNRDADAPIFRVADYGIVGDVFEVVPALTAAVRKLRAE